MTLPIDRPVASPTLIARAAQLETLHRLSKRAAAAQGQIALISGEAGIGKSRLVAEARREMLKNVYVLQGRCFEHDQALPYAPLLDIPQLAKHLSDMAANPALDPEQDKRRRHQSLRDFLLDITVSQPLTLVIEDLHWCDDTTLEFLTFLTRGVLTHSIFLLLTYRSDEVQPSLAQFLAGLERQRLGVEVALPRLTAADVDAMLNAIFELDRAVPPDFLEALYDLTEGNPFFIEEVLKSLIAAGDIFFADGKWERKPLAELHIPRTVQVAVQQRAARLTAEAKTMLTLAAVAGRRFDFGLLQHLTQQDEKTLLGLMRELMAAQLVVEESADTFAFRHALTRQAVYAELLARERRALHRAIAEALELLYSDQVESRLTDLAYHFYAGEVWSQAMNYSQEAGQQAQRLNAPSVALEHFTHALLAARHLNLTPPPTLYRARGQTHGVLGNFEAARGDYEESLQSARKVHDQQAECQAFLDLGWLWTERDYEQAGDYFAHALNLAHQMKDSALPAHALNKVGNWYMHTNQVQQARQYHEEALSIFKSLADRRGQAETLDLLGITSFCLGDIPGGAAYYRQAIDLFRELGDSMGLVAALPVFAMRGASYQLDTTVCEVTSLATCVAEMQEALRVARNIGWRAGEATSHLYSAFAQGSFGMYQPALDSAQNALAIATEIEHTQWSIAVHLVLGALYRDLLDETEAQHHHEEAVRIAQTIGSAFVLHLSSGYLASTCITFNHLARAENILTSMLTIDTPMISIGQRYLWCARAELALAQGEAKAALPIFDKLIHSALNIRDGQNVIPRLWHRRGETLLALNRWAEAERVLQAAYTAAEQQGTIPNLWRIQISQGKLYLTLKRREAAEDAFEAGRAVIDELADPLTDETLRESFRAQAKAMIPAIAPLSPRRAVKRAFDGLTSREREVAACIAQGQSNRAIADTLILSERTIEKHVENIFSKLGFSARSQIAVWAVEKGLLRPLD